MLSSLELRNQTLLKVSQCIVDTQQGFLTDGRGRTLLEAARGAVFSHTFNYPGNYWNGASGGVNYLLEINNPPSIFVSRMKTNLHFKGFSI